MAQEVGGKGLTPIDPENITNQTSFFLTYSIT